MRDRSGVRCHCQRCTIRGLMGPAVVITVGVLFLLQQMRGGSFEFGNTYPVILIVIGGILLASALAPADGHISAGPAATPTTAAAPPAPPAAPASTASSGPSSMPGQGQ